VERKREHVHAYAQLPSIIMKSRKWQVWAKHAVEVDVKRVCEGELVRYGHDSNEAKAPVFVLVSLK
jgi:hypothetical protein